MRKIFEKAKQTKTCVVFQCGQPRTPEHTTLYLKKDELVAADIDPEKGIVVTIEEQH